MLCQEQLSILCGQPERVSLFSSREDNIANDVENAVAEASPVGLSDRFEWHRHRMFGKDLLGWASVKRGSR